jgi:hypothetical protein
VEGEMTKESRRARIRLELTEGQKEQIRKATGRTVNSLELGLESLTGLGPDERPDDNEEAADR